MGCGGCVGRVLFAGILVIGLFGCLEAVAFVDGGFHFPAMSIYDKLGAATVAWLIALVASFGVK